MNARIGMLLGVLAGSVVGYFLRRHGPGGRPTGGAGGPTKITITIDEEPLNHVPRAQVCPDPAWATQGQKVHWHVENRCGGPKTAALTAWSPAKPGKGNDKTNRPVPGHGANDDIYLDPDTTGMFKYSIDVDGVTVLDPGIIIDKP